MTSAKIIGAPLPNIPWQPRPAGSDQVLWRHDQNPIISWNPTRRTARAFNSSVVPYGDGFVGVFRADHKNIKPLLHVGRSNDGLVWELEDEEIQWKDPDGASYQPNFAFDPRLVKVEDTYYVVWCTDFDGMALGFGMTKDFVEFTRLENLTIPYNRNGVLFPRRIDGKYQLLSRPSDIGHTRYGDIYLSESPDLVHWGRHRKVMSTSGPSWWQALKIGGGAVPIETSEGWLVFYHGVTETCNGFVYSVGAAILDIDHPAKVLFRTQNYLLTPEMPYETTGFVPNVVFPCATLQDADTGRIAVYYGAADSHTALAYTQIDELVEHIKADSFLEYGDAEEYR
jgi:beta-1,4-mannooligosaccharide/beta-1,4-mannosyl-N-acetylglucosamine phosphorylase